MDKQLSTTLIRISN